MVIWFQGVFLTEFFLDFSVVKTRESVLAVKGFLIPTYLPCGWV